MGRSEVQTSEGRTTTRPKDRVRWHDPSCSLKWSKRETLKLAATLRWFTAGGAIHIAVRQLSQTWKLRH